MLSMLLYEGEPINKKFLWPDSGTNLWIQHSTLGVSHISIFVRNAS